MEYDDGTFIFNYCNVSVTEIINSSAGCLFADVYFIGGGKIQLREEAARNFIDEYRQYLALEGSL